MVEKFTKYFLKKIYVIAPKKYRKKSFQQNCEMKLK